MIDWLILTGGAGSRLGQDKASTRIAGRTMLERVQEAITQADPQARIQILGPRFGGGPAAAVTTALAHCRSPYVGVVAVDMPMAKDAIAAVLAAIDDQAEAWIPEAADGRRQWLCAVYRRSALLREAGNRDWTDQPFHQLVSGLTDRIVSVGSSASLLDIDTPADLKQAVVQIEESEGMG